MPTPKEELTVKRLENLIPALQGQRYEISDTHVKGMRVRVGDAAVESGDRRRKGKAAHISFVLLARFKLGASPTRRTLGTFPELSLTDARQKAVEWKALIRKGVDPADEIARVRRDEETARQNRRTLSEILDQYEREKLCNLRSGDATRRALDGKSGLLSTFLDREPSTITRAEIRAKVRSRAAESPISANRQLAYANAFFNWCLREEIVQENPARFIAKPSQEKSRDRYHSTDELREIWVATEKLGYPFGPWLRLVILLPMRRKELAAIPISEIELGDEDATESIWTLPAGRTKNASALKVPIPPLARSIILEAINDKGRPAKSPFVFSTTEKTPISGFAKAKRRLDSLIDRQRIESANEAAVDPVPMPHWTVHDLRTTFTTLACAKLNIDAGVADRILNHVASATTSKLTRTYNQFDLFERRREALYAWENFIRAEVIGPKSEKVVPIRQASA
ncbi:integrase arm-type DNA-binding domain-containing protein [Altererythrobacter confluentis]|uniref:Integrase arm-type DNA-binding domain-containing protein n=1 Tax=Allopontixanthobacter confluentis TaxID=1849021 RepID=A0A6L7GH64_9SPHN|nr:integrase arm-type DNA-binding domain-containing protein [Allopontixanthobacter confluentis]